MAVSAQDTVPLLGTALNISPGRSLGLRHQALGRYQAFLLFTRPACPWGGINKPLALFWERGRNVRGRLLQ